MALGALEGDRVVVADAAQAGRLRARGEAGTVDGQGRLVLSTVEAAWHAAEGRLAISEAGALVAFADLVARGGPGAEAAVLAYRDLRERGLVARPAEGDRRLAVWPRGTGEGPPAYHVRCREDTEPLAVADLLAAGESGDVLCVVDADGVATHYQASRAAPGGDVPPGDLPRAKGTVLPGRVLVADAAAADAYHRREFFGTPHPAGLLLSFPEAELLRRRGVLSVPPGLADRDGSARLLPAQAALRASGAVAKSGLRFGTDLRAYRGAPDEGHAEWLVHCAAGSDALPWSVLARGVRLAHGVRKAFLVAVAGAKAGGADRGNDVRFTQLAWFRP